MKIPYLHERHGRLYVRIQYRRPDGRMAAKERTVQNEREALTAIAEIKAQLGARTLTSPGGIWIHSLNTLAKSGSGRSPTAT